MGSEEEGHEAELERRDKRNERLERNIMVFQGILALFALAAIAWWATGHSVPVPAWLAIVAIQCVMQIFAQKTIRLLRRANRAERRYADMLHGQYERLMDAFRLGAPKVDP